MKDNASHNTVNLNAENENRKYPMPLVIKKLLKLQEIHKNCHLRHPDAFFCIRI